jgi:hypothetical protein
MIISNIDIDRYYQAASFLSLTKVVLTVSERGLRPNLFRRDGGSRRVGTTSLLSCLLFVGEKEVSRVF